MKLPLLLPKMSMFCLIFFACGFANGDLVTNGSFEHPGAQDQTNFNGIGGGGNAAADGWLVFNNTNGSTETEHMLYSEALLPPIFPGDPGAGGEHVIRVEASHTGNGIVQVFSPLGTGPASAIAEAWVYVNSGVVASGIGNGGATAAINLTSNTGVWEKLTFSESTSPVNEIVFYASGGSSEFYVDLVRVSAVPEPTFAGIAGLIGMTLLMGRRRRRIA